MRRRPQADQLGIADLIGCVQLDIPEHAREWSEVHCFDRADVRGEIIHSESYTSVSSRESYSVVGTHGKPDGGNKTK
jgi:hypothetical protein